MKIISQIKLEKDFVINNIPYKEIENLILFLEKNNIKKKIEINKNIIGLRIVNNKISNYSTLSETYKGFIYNYYKYYTYKEFYKLYMI